MSIDSKIDLTESPCVRNCCLDDEDVCLGCFRTLVEITGWNDSTFQEKQEILERCALRRGKRPSPSILR